MAALSTTLLLCSLAAIPPTARTSAKRSARISVPNRTARVNVAAPARNQQGSAELAALLAAYANGKGGTKFERTVLHEMDGSKKAAAKRILDGLQAVPARDRRRAIGKTSVGSRVAKAPLKAIVDVPLPSGSIQYLLPAVQLPPEGAPKVTTFDLERAGVVTLSTEDADGTDELTTMEILVTANGSGYDMQTLDPGTELATGVGASAVRKSLYSGKGSDAVLVTALIEDDEGNAAMAKEEIGVLLDLAGSVASTMQGDRMDVFKTMVDYTTAVDASGADPNRAARSVVANRIHTADWMGLWSTTPSKTGGIAYKVAIPHTMGSGSYELLLDVPAPPLPTLQTVRVSARNFSAPMTRPGHLELQTCQAFIKIGDVGHTFELPLDDMKTVGAVERRVRPGKVVITVGAGGTWVDPRGYHNEKVCKTKDGKKTCRTELVPPTQSVKESVDLVPGGSFKFAEFFAVPAATFLAAKGAIPRSNKVTEKTMSGTGELAGHVTVHATVYAGQQKRAEKPTLKRGG